jgi:hypothetical protein
VPVPAHAVLDEGSAETTAFANAHGHASAPVVLSNDDSWKNGVVAGDSEPNAAVRDRVDAARVANGRLRPRERAASRMVHRGRRSTSRGPSYRRGKGKQDEQGASPRSSSRPLRTTHSTVWLLRPLEPSVFTRSMTA